jgi:glycerol-3-phosphate acyltransferase PlsX
MGGDRGPEVVVPAVERAYERHPSVRFVLAGNESRLAALVAKRPRIKDVVSIRHAETNVAMDEKPSQALRQALRRRRGSSMWLALEEVRDGRAHACVSAGNTGALMAMAKVSLKMIEGIERPAIAAVWPNRRGEAVFLDMGANVEANARQLVEYALMGHEYARIYLNVENPRVALLNIGTEALKGKDSIREAAVYLSNPELNIEYIGFVEGTDIFTGIADVIVTDGFTGNIALKTAEGTASAFVYALKIVLKRTWLSRLGALLAMGALRALKERLDPRSANGGVFLGLNGIVVKSHGGADVLGFAAAIDVAVDMAASDLIGRIKVDSKRVHEIIGNQAKSAEDDTDSGFEAQAKLS